MRSKAWPVHIGTIECAQWNQIAPAAFFGAMGSAKHPRFFCRKSSQDHWTVWDEERDEPASLGGRSLEDIPELRARAACGILTSIFDSGLDAASIRPVRRSR